MSIEKLGKKLEEKSESILREIFLIRDYCLSEEVYKIPNLELTKITHMSKPCNQQGIPLQEFQVPIFANKFFHITICRVYWNYNKECLRKVYSALFKEDLLNRKYVIIRRKETFNTFLKRLLPPLDAVSLAKRPQNDRTDLLIAAAMLLSNTES